MVVRDHQEGFDTELLREFVTDRVMRPSTEKEAKFSLLFRHILLIERISGRKSKIPRPSNTRFEN
jgi:hypothetical protein